jgi:hypothetical protein
MFLLLLIAAAQMSCNKDNPVENSPQSAYMTISLDGEEVDMTDFGIEAGDSLGNIIIYTLYGRKLLDNGYTRNFKFFIPAPLADGTYTGDNLWIVCDDYLPGSSSSWSGQHEYYCDGFNDCNQLELELTSVGEVGEYITGEMNGVLAHYYMSQFQGSRALNVRFQMLRTVE